MASEETSTPPVEPSSWSRLPAIDGHGEPNGGAHAGAELRLHRIGVVTALLQIEPDAGRQALARLERDVSAPPG